jgi:hypothetical protein
MRRGSMRFNIGDKLRHRGLKWLWGTVEEIYEAISIGYPSSKATITSIEDVNGNLFQKERRIRKDPCA